MAAGTPFEALEDLDPQLAAAAKRWFATIFLERVDSPTLARQEVIDGLRLEVSDSDLAVAFGEWFITMAEWDRSWAELEEIVEELARQAGDEWKERQGRQGV